MQVFNVGVFLQPITFQILILIQKKKVKKVKKCIRIPTLRQNFCPLALPEAVLELMSELWTENIHRKHECRHKRRVIRGRLPLFPEKEENKNPSNWTLSLSRAHSELRAQ